MPRKAPTISASSAVLIIDEEWENKLIGLCLLGLIRWPNSLGGLSDVFRCTVGGLGSYIADSKKGLLCLFRWNFDCLEGRLYFFLGAENHVNYISLS